MMEKQKLRMEKENLNELEEIVNLIEKGNECDRINLTKVGRIMKKKYDKFMENDDLKDEALAIAKFQSQQKAKVQKKKNQKH